MEANPLYDKVCDWQTLKRSYKQTQIAERKYRRENVLYDMARERNLIALWRELKSGAYKMGDYIRFKVYEPKERIVSAPHVRDKIVQYAAHLQLMETYLPVFIRDTYGCIKGRGTHGAVDQVQHFMRLCKWKHGGCWVLKMDVRKFFYSIDRDVLKKLYRKKIKDEKFLALLDMIVDSSPEGEKGLPLGNVTSQDFANIYLNEVDQYAKRFLGVKYYVRYMDDIIVCVPTKAEAQELLVKFRVFVEDRLHLELNEKTDIFPVSQGVNAYGFRIFTTHTVVRTQSKRVMKRKMKALHRKLVACPNKETRKRYLSRVKLSINSWLGHARHSNSYTLARKIFRRYTYVKVQHQTYLFGMKERPKRYKPKPLNEKRQT